MLQFLPEWVKADRIIRKELKELDVKPTVAFSSFDPFSSSRESKESESIKSISSEPTVSQPTTSPQRSHALVEVIETPSELPTSSHETLEVQTPQSLLLINKEEPTKTDSLLQLMKRQSQALVVVLIYLHQ